MNSLCQQYEHTLVHTQPYPIFPLWLAVRRGDVSATKLIRKTNVTLQGILLYGSETTQAAASCRKPEPADPTEESGERRENSALHRKRGLHLDETCCFVEGKS